MFSFIKFIFASSLTLPAVEAALPPPVATPLQTVEHTMLAVVHSVPNFISHESQGAQ